MVTILAYSPGFSAPFVFDDDVSIQKNPTIRTLEPFVALRPPGGDLAVSGRPLVNYSFAVNYALNRSLGVDQRADPDGPRKTVSYHLFNLFLHLGAASLLFALVRRTLRFPQFESWHSAADSVALAVASIWLVHPLHTEAVLYTVQRTEILSSLLCLAALYASVRAWDAESPNARTRWRALGVACCVAGLASKEVAVVIPVLVMLYDRAFRLRSWRELVRPATAPVGYYAILAAVSVAGCVIQLRAGARASTVGLGHGITWYEYLYSQGWAIGRYLRLGVIPLGLTLDYGTRPTTGLGALPGLAVLLVLGAITIAAWMRAERWGWLAFLGSWFFVLLAPSSSVVPIASEIAAERRIYLALAAVIIAVVVLVRSRLTTSGRAGFVVTAIVFTVFAALTYRRSAQYADPEQLWREAIERVPENARAYTSLAYTLLHAPSPRVDEAVPYLHRAIALDPTALSPLRSLAAIELSKGHLPAARQLLQRAYALDPDYADVAPLLGVVLAATGEREQATKYLADPKVDRLAENDPSGSLVVALGNAYMSLGRWDAAFTVFSRALEWWPNRADCYFSAGDALVRLGRPADALPRIERGLQIDPQSALGYALLSQADAGVHRADDAVNAAQVAFRKAPTDASIVLMLGQAMLTLGRPADAERFMREAFRLDPGNPRAATELAIAMDGAGRRAAAIALLERVIASLPGYEPARSALERDAKPGQIGVTRSAALASLERLARRKVCVVVLGDDARGREAMSAPGVVFVRPGNQVVVGRDATRVR